MVLQTKNNRTRFLSYEVISYNVLTLKQDHKSNLSMSRYYKNKNRINSDPKQNIKYTNLL